ncbi:MAG: hypothetical protein IPH51_13895 [Rubrivivax sp.]|nr:hypothetical protein [Rubrivivax sp.]
MQALERVGDHVFSTTKGVKSIFGTTLSGWAAQVVGDAIEGFQLKACRSGVETLLAAEPHPAARSAGIRCHVGLPASPGASL